MDCMKSDVGRTAIMYQAIDQERTGLKLKMMLRRAGYDVKYVQNYLSLSCPQPIYRWFKGKILPSVEHLCALSRLLHVHMEELIVLKGYTEDGMDWVGIDDSVRRRLAAYINYFQRTVHAAGHGCFTQ